MRKFQNIKFLSFLFILGILATSCVHDDDFKVPEINLEEPNVNVNTDIASIKAMYRGFEPVLIEGNGEMFMEAYVISDDESGNIYKQMFLQDKPENPTAGVVLSTHATDLYTKYAPGQKIYFRVDGLYIGEYAGLPTIGIQEGSDVGRMNIDDFQERIYRSLEKATLVPSVITIPEASNPNRLSTLVKFEGVQFPDDVAGTDYYGNIDNTFSVNRTVEDCQGNSIILRNSGFADFKNDRLPAGNGSMVAINSIFANDIQLFIRDTNDVDMTGERCDGSTGGGGGDPTPGEAVELPFSQNFEGHAAGTGANVNLPGWININVGGGTRVWEVREFDNNKYAQTSAYSANQNPYEVWLITPGLILPSGSSPILKFDTNDGHYNGDALSVKISTNFDGNLSTATWTELNANISSGHTNGYGANFVSSGEIDLSAYAGQVVYIGYQYLGGSDGITTTYQIDNISVAEDNGGGGNPDPPGGGDGEFLFAGGDFEDWSAFLAGLNEFGIKDYANQSMGTGVDGSASLHIATDPTTTGGNDYVFTANAASGLPSSYSKISFYMRGSSSKSVSFNVYNTDGSYTAYNLGDLTSSVTIQPAGNNQYNGTINTGGNWVLVTLDISTLNSVNVSDTSSSILALKIGREANYDLHFDNFTIE